MIIISSVNRIPRIPLPSLFSLLVAWDYNNLIYFHILFIVRFKNKTE